MSCITTSVARTLDDYLRPMAVVTETWLLPLIGSATVLLTNAVLLIDPLMLAPTFTEICTVRAASTASALVEQETVTVAPVDGDAQTTSEGAVTLTNVVPAGIVSLTTTPVAGFGP